MTILKKPVRRVSNVGLDGSFGSDRNRRIVITLIPGNGDDVPDLIELRPERTRRAETIAVMDVYRYAVRSRVFKEKMEKGKEKEAKKRARAADAAITRAAKRDAKRAAQA